MAVSMQLEFSLHNESSLARELASLTGMRVQLTITDNTRTVMSVARDREGGGVRVRLHHMFLGANQRVVHAIAAWIKRPKSREAAAALDAFIRENRPMMRARQKRAAALEPEGKHFDLRVLFQEVNTAYFNGTITAGITWGRFGNGNSRRQRTIRFGSYSVEDDLVRIHPLLDQAFVPEYFVRYIVFHEMLHAFLGIEESETGRRRIHTRDFQRREREYGEYAKATAWEQNPANIRKLLKGKPDAQSGR